MLAGMGRKADTLDDWDREVYKYLAWHVRRCATCGRSNAYWWCGDGKRDWWIVNGKFRKNPLGCEWCKEFKQTEVANGGRLPRRCLLVWDERRLCPG